MKPTAERAPHASGLLSVVEKMLKVWATLDYGSRTLLQPAIYPFKEWCPDLHVQALFQGEFVRSVPKFRVLG